MCAPPHCLKSMVLMFYCKDSALYAPGEQVSSPQCAITSISATTTLLWVIWYPYQDPQVFLKCCTISLFYDMCLSPRGTITTNLYNVYSGYGACKSLLLTTMSTFQPSSSSWSPFHRISSPSALNDLSPQELAARSRDHYFWTSVAYPTTHVTDTTVKGDPSPL